MSDEPKPPMPEQPITKPVPQILVSSQTLESILTSLQTIDRKVDSNHADVQEWKAEIEDKLAGRSMQPSKHDLANEAKLAEEIAARKAVESKVDALMTKTDAQTAILQRLDKFAENPTVKRIATIVGTAIAVWLGAHFGVHL